MLIMLSIYTCAFGSLSHIVAQSPRMTSGHTLRCGPANQRGSRLFEVISISRRVKTLMMNGAQLMIRMVIESGTQQAEGIIQRSLYLSLSLSPSFSISLPLSIYLMTLASERFWN